MQFHRRRCYSSLLILVCCLALGCTPPPEIKTYTVDSTSPRSAAFPVDQVDQILVAIVPHETTAWFFKLVGKKPAIERQREAFEKFLATVELADSPGETPTWQVPEGWSEGGEAEMRVATLLVPDSGGELELAVSSLPLTTEWEEFLVPNVNRWLRQLQCNSLNKEKILELAQEAKTDGAEATIFHLAGLMPEQPRANNPHAGLGIPAPKSTPPAASPSAAPSGSAELSYDTPEGWLPGKMSMMRKAAFVLPGGGASDEVTVTRFPAGGGQMSDVEANVMRWAGQVGMSPPSGEQLAELTEPITIDGHEGTYVELASPESSQRKVSLYVAMVERQGQVWFFKLIGGSELVASESAAFREFLASVKFK